MNPKRKLLVKKAKGDRPAGSRPVVGKLSTNALSLIVGAILGAGTSFYLGPGERSSTAGTVRSGPWPVKRVIDGDTVVLQIEGREETVRLIGVDTPETVKPGTPMEPYGPEANRFTKNLLSGEEVLLEYERNGKAGKDRFGRTLAYIYRSPDGLFVNSEIIRQGYGRLYRKEKSRLHREFEMSERAARRAGRGMWGIGLDGR
ncbi:MAG: thermonuclease [Calditrichaeota bacterium]|nr:thermonuclease [Calditrichota bacterium]